MGFIGGNLGYQLLKWVSPQSRQPETSPVPAQIGKPKLKIFFPEKFWEDIRGKTVLDFGCGEGAEAVEMVKRGAARVIGIDIRERVLAIARQRAEAEGVSDRCQFFTECPQPVDIVVTVDAFEHFGDPGAMLRLMSSLLVPGGVIWAVFGPIWYHPFGGHTFSVFPWAHLIFTESALLRWRSDFKTDGARRFSEVEGGLNQMTIHRFLKLVAESGLQQDFLDLIPIGPLRFFQNRLTREFFTSSVRCRLTKPLDSK